jgi:hypothetical protein
MWSCWWNENGKGNGSTWRKPSPVLLTTTNPTWFPRDQTGATVVVSQWLTAWAMAQPVNVNNKAHQSSHNSKIMNWHHKKGHAYKNVVFNLECKIFKVCILLHVYIYYDQTFSVNATLVLFYFISLALHVLTTLSHHQVLHILVYNYQTVTFTFYICINAVLQQITSQHWFTKIM